VGPIWLVLVSKSTKTWRKKKSTKTWRKKKRGQPTHVWIQEKIEEYRWDTLEWGENSKTIREKKAHIVDEFGTLERIQGHVNVGLIWLVLVSKSTKTWRKKKSTKTWRKKKRGQPTHVWIQEKIEEYRWDTLEWGENSKTIREKKAHIVDEFGTLERIQGHVNVGLIWLVLVSKSTKTWRKKKSTKTWRKKKRGQPTHVWIQEKIEEYRWDTLEWGENSKTIREKKAHIVDEFGTLERIQGHVNVGLIWLVLVSKSTKTWRKKKSTKTWRKKKRSQLMCGYKKKYIGSNGEKIVKQSEKRRLISWTNFLF
jgi:hypothetical protein